MQCSSVTPPQHVRLAPPRATAPAASAKLCSAPALRLCSTGCSAQALAISQTQTPSPAPGPSSSSKKRGHEEVRAHGIPSAKGRGVPNTMGVGSEVSSKVLFLSWSRRLFLCFLRLTANPKVGGQHGLT